jgi:hypothetical protein
MTSSLIKDIKLIEKISKQQHVKAHLDLRFGLAEVTEEIEDIDESLFKHCSPLVGLNSGADINQ